MHALQMMFRVALEGVPSYEYLHGWDKLSFDDYLTKLAEMIGKKDFRVQIVGTNAQGLVLILVGDLSHSRLIAVHSKDTRGVIYILNDIGFAATLEEEHEPLKAVTYTRLVEAGYVSVKTALEIAQHENGRLSDDEMIMGCKLFGPVESAPMFGKPELAENQSVRPGWGPRGGKG